MRVSLAKRRNSLQFRSPSDETLKTVPADDRSYSTRGSVCSAGASDRIGSCGEEGGFENGQFAGGVSTFLERYSSRPRPWLCRERASRPGERRKTGRPSCRIERSRNEGSNCRRRVEGPGC